MDQEAQAQSPSQTPPEKRSLLRDNRGAIMVMGVFMATLVAGMLYYIIGIGETILLRERLQDGTDAGAFAAAVLHARGMNLIALINMIMAAVLSVLVALRIAEAIALAAALLADGVCAASIFGCAPCAVACGFAGPLHTAHRNIKMIADRVEPIVHGILRVGHAAEVGIKFGMPVAAQIKVVNLSRGAYRPPMDFAFVVPLYRPLPVEDDDFSVLCGKAAEIVGAVVTAPIDRFLGVPIVGSLIRRLARSLAETFPGFFCGSSDGGGGGGTIDVSDAFSPEDRRACEDAREEAASRDPPEEVECPDSISPGGGGTGAIDSSDGSGGCSMCPQRVVEGLNLGDEEFQLRVVGIGSVEERYNLNEQGVSVATLGDLPEEGGFYSVLKNLDRLGVAQAEFYFDCNGGDECEPEDWMWHANWRARLRRFRISGLVGSVDGFCSTASADDSGGGAGGACGGIGGGIDMIESVIIH